MDHPPQTPQTPQTPPAVTLLRRQCKDCGTNEAKLTGYDQLIHEFGAWVHVGLPFIGSTPRHQSLTIGGRPVTTRTGLLPL